MRLPRILALATAPLIVLGLFRPAYVGSAHATPASRSAAIIRPITLPPPVFAQFGYVDAPGTYPLQATASAVTVKWYDRSDNEQGFKVFRRDLSGNWQQVYDVPTRDMADSGEGTDDYTWVDTSTDISGQCYMIAAYNASSAGYTSEECTVRPDPSRFPQAVGRYAVQWSGLSSANDGTGGLVNTNMDMDLLYANRTWGANLAWSSDTSLWRVEAQGGPHLMKGQAVALKVWGGGWLAYGHQTFGADVTLSPTPVYEWYAIGLRGDASESTWAGTDLTDGGTFALWNSAAQAYLVSGYQFWGVGLEWYRVGGGSAPSPTPTPTQHGVKTEQVFNCATDQDAAGIWIDDLSAGTGFVYEGALATQYGDGGCPTYGSTPFRYNPVSGHSYLLVATDNALPDCDGNDPEESACRKMTVQFQGDANGYTRTDTIDGGTQIT
jgi:hypothetical protein